MKTFHVSIVAWTAIGAVTIAGCTSPPPATLTGPTLTLIGAGDCPLVVTVRLTNNANMASTASYTGFRVVDANGTLGSVDAATTASFAASSFPLNVSLNRGESAQGVVAFFTGIRSRPYTLMYDLDGLRAHVQLNAAPPGQEPCASAPTAPRTSPALALLGEGDCPLLVTVRLTNQDNRTATASSMGFKMVDTNETVGPVDPATTESYGPNRFPANVSLDKGQSAEGAVAFSGAINNRPYTLRYDYGGLRAEIRLLAPPPGEDGCSGPPTPQKPNLILTAGTWNNGNLTVSLASITNANNLSTADLACLVQSSDGTTYFTGVVGTWGPIANVTVTVAYWDNANHGKVSNEDNIRITVSPFNSTAIRGGSLKIFFAGDVIGLINQLP